MAEEVRNLALRSAEAARNTAELIQLTLGKIKNGSEVVQITNDNFAEVADSSTKVGELVGEIAMASSEQADGIGQLNSAMSQMDIVVQQNAASAEESASASEEMNNQAAVMLEHVDKLASLVEGGAAKKEHRPSKKDQIRSTLPQEKQVKRAAQPKALAATSPADDPSKVIPFDDDDFDDF